MEHLGQVRFHPGAFARGKDDGESLCHLTSKIPMRFREPPAANARV
jgi:hypothetical protein